MKTDSLFYELFKIHPASLFELAGVVVNNSFADIRDSEEMFIPLILGNEFPGYFVSSLRDFLF